MRNWARAGLLLLELAAVGHAYETQINQKEGNRQVCSGMYSRKSWGGNTDPYIMTKFVKSTGENAGGDDPIVSFVVFEWKDKNLIGKPLSADGDPNDRVYICEQANVDAGYCTTNDLGAFILADNATSVSRSDILNMPIHLSDPPAVNYPIRRTGYYCVGTFDYSDEDYTAIVEFRNAFGELPAAQIAKLPFYSAMTIVYAFLAIGWGALYYFHRHDILAVQNYITAILIFLVIEQFMTWLFYDFQNRHGLNTGAKVLLVFVSILSAGRNSFSFFLLLIVCMGYGVAKPSLGKTMVYVRWLAVAHFTFGVLYAVASLSVTPENAGPLILLVVLPLAATLTAFYVWTLSSLNATMKDLMQRRQTVKASMYRKLWWCILASIGVIFIFFFVNSWSFAGSRSEDFVPNHWSTRWFVLDGWLNLVYLFDVAFIAYVWRPSANNRRFAMSDEIAQDDDGFEIASLRDSFDLDGLDDLEPGTGMDKPYGAVPSNNTSGGGGGLAVQSNGGNARRDISPLPAPVPTKPVSSMPTRASLDEGETIFALGEEEGDSDEDGDEEERRGLTGGKG